MGVRALRPRGEGGIALLAGMEDGINDNYAQIMMHTPRRRQESNQHLKQTMRP